MSDFENSQIVQVVKSVKALSSPSVLYSKKELESGALLPRRPGVYAWYFNEIPPYVPSNGCKCKHEGRIFKTNWTLLYIGKAKILKERILDEHFTGKLVRGQAQSSLRQTLGCLLSKSLGICLWKYPGFDPSTYTFGDVGEERLSKWMAKHTRVFWVEIDAITDTETLAIRSHILPLNTEGNANHPFIPVLKKVRADLRNCAEFLDSKPPKKAVKKAYAEFKKLYKSQKYDSVRPEVENF